MTNYKPISLTVPKDERRDKLTFSKRCTFLYLSILFNVLTFGFILRESHKFKSIFFDRIFGQGWHSGLDTAPAAAATNDDSRISHCVLSLPPKALPPVPINLWAPLNISEMSAIYTWLEAPERNLNLTRLEAISDNIVSGIETYYPPKLAALAYLENPATSPPPERFARVTIHHGGVQVPAVVSYLVGPLPVDPRTAIRPLREIYHRDNIPFNARGWSDNDEENVSHFLSREVAPIAHVIKELFGGIVQGYQNDTLVASAVGPFSYDGSSRRFWMTWTRNTGGTFLLPVNFYSYVDISGTDRTQWKILKLMYHDQLFPSTQSFLEASNNGTLKRHPEQADTKADYSWPQRQRRGHDRDLDHLPGPRSVSFAGLRYRVDRERQYISWLGWGMYLGFNRDMGLNLWDIRFRGERIIYQLAPQEAMAQYAGNNPAQASTVWLDSYFGMGGSVKDLIPQYDCPAESVYLPATTFSSIGNVQRPRAICVFEQDVGRPLSRHYGYQEGETGAIKSYVLTIRSISTFDYLFYLDGTIEVRVSASGYLQGGYWNPEQEDYGSRIYKSSMGNVHDHVINFKVDMDIAGTNNSLLRTSIKQEEVPRPWLDEDNEWGKTAIEQKIVKEYIENENDALLRYPPNFTGGYSFVNRDITNAWGYPRGYSIRPGNSPIFNTVTGSKRMLKNANWAQYNLAISLRKETEPASSAMWNLNLPGEPVVDFHNFFDGDNITQQDLVAWINVGTHHYPSAEDSPNTKTITATSSFMLTPVNYFDYDVSMESRNSILIYPPKEPGAIYEFDDNGVQANFHCCQMLHRILNILRLE
ncbi:amine oxidase catalytic domain-containing protein [Phlegmacium glaucopus]|nr:amine oxidase catalytic domain-containing protein [Phlegmacium glaucopus]